MKRALPAPEGTHASSPGSPRAGLSFALDLRSGSFHERPAASGSKRPRTSEGSFLVLRPAGAPHEPPPEQGQGQGQGQGQTRPAAATSQMPGALEGSYLSLGRHQEPAACQRPLPALQPGTWPGTQGEREREKVWERESGREKEREKMWERDSAREKEAGQLPLEMLLSLYSQTFLGGGRPHALSQSPHPPPAMPSALAPARALIQHPAQIPTHPTAHTTAQTPAHTTSQTPAQNPAHTTVHIPAQTPAQASVFRDVLQASFTCASEQAFASIAEAMAYLQKHSSRPGQKGTPKGSDAGRGTGREGGGEAEGEGKGEGEAGVEARMGSSRALGSLLAAQQGLLKMVELWELVVRPDTTLGRNSAIPTSTPATGFPLKEGQERSQAAPLALTKAGEPNHATPAAAESLRSLQRPAPGTQTQTQSCGLDSAPAGALSRGSAHGAADLRRAWEMQSGMRPGSALARGGLALSGSSDAAAQSRAALWGEARDAGTRAPTTDAPCPSSAAHSSCVTASPLTPAHDFLAAYANRVASHARVQPTFAVEGPLGVAGASLVMAGSVGGTGGPLRQAGAFQNAGGPVIPRLSEASSFANPLANALDSGPEPTPERLSASQLVAALLAAAARGPSPTAEAFFSRVPTAASASPVNQFPNSLGLVTHGLKPPSEPPRTAEGCRPSSALRPTETGGVVAAAAAAATAATAASRLSPVAGGEEGKWRGGEQDAPPDATASPCVVPSAESPVGPPSSKVVLEVASQGPVLDPGHDGYHWRRYGRKYIKDQQFPRLYYRCSTDRCEARKHMQVVRKGGGGEGPEGRAEWVTAVSYEHLHSHAKEPRKGSHAHAHAHATAVDLARGRRAKGMSPLGKLAPAGGEENGGGGSAGGAGGGGGEEGGVGGGKGDGEGEGEGQLNQLLALVPRSSWAKELVSQHKPEETRAGQGQPTALPGNSSPSSPGDCPSGSPSPQDLSENHSASSLPLPRPSPVQVMRGSRSTGHLKRSFDSDPPSWDGVTGSGRDSARGRSETGSAGEKVQGFSAAVSALLGKDTGSRDRAGGKKNVPGPTRSESKSREEKDPEASQVPIGSALEASSLSARKVPNMQSSWQVTSALNQSSPTETTLPSARLASAARLETTARLETPPPATCTQVETKGDAAASKTCKPGGGVDMPLPLGLGSGGARSAVPYSAERARPKFLQGCVQDGMQDSTGEGQSKGGVEGSGDSGSSLVCPTGHTTPPQGPSEDALGRSDADQAEGGNKRIRLFGRNFF